MSTLETSTIPNPVFWDPDNLEPWSHDCGASDPIGMVGDREYVLDADEYYCRAGWKGSGSACTACELRWAWHRLGKAEDALKAAGIEPHDLYPEMMPAPVEPTAEEIAELDERLASLRNNRNASL